MPALDVLTAPVLSRHLAERRLFTSTGMAFAFIITPSPALERKSEGHEHDEHRGQGQDKHRQMVDRAIHR